MRQVIITGINGTVAPVLARYLRSKGVSVLGWNRESIPVDNEYKIRLFLEENRPDWIAHLATGSSHWAELIARLCDEYQIKLLYTSSVSVFSSEQIGPFMVDMEPKPADDYGRYKLECEQRMTAVNKDLIIARLGWQIGEAPGSNNMMDFLHRKNEEEGRINASTRWYPGCSFLEDTAEALHELSLRNSPGIYHIDGNPGMNLYEISQALNHKYEMNWEISKSDQPKINSLMKDDRIAVKSINERL